jgi:hypothetical protein
MRVESVNTRLASVMLYFTQLQLCIPTHMALLKSLQALADGRGFNLAWEKNMEAPGKGGGTKRAGTMMIYNWQRTAQVARRS